jgi:hypothetical protein
MNANEILELDDEEAMEYLYHEEHGYEWVQSSHPFDYDDHGTWVEDIWDVNGRFIALAWYDSSGGDYSPEAYEVVPREKTVVEYVRT